ncbi:CAF1-domain-containing protein [Stipitochalara longipes BDJ]|nr:CAF1-domain-containing protein [Stipitochalara longipes BDJ]
MDVDQDHFRKELLEILRNIAKANFITFDLEMSGISTRKPGDRPNVGKLTLQDLYEEVRDAAETFQILQLGITCVEEHGEKEYYLARPYNFNVSPKSADGVDLRLERVFSFSSSACDFLAKNKFDFGKIFTHGVPYLSRDEENGCREEYNGRADRNANMKDIIINPSNQSVLDFVRGVRRTISTWLKAPKPKPDFVNISHPDGHIKDGRINALDGYQRRLIHQVVRKEFPALKAISRKDGSFMQITELDLEEEARFQAKKLRQFDSQLCKQKGLRWIFEALVGGDLSGIDPEWLASKTSENPEDQLPVVKKQLGRIIRSLQRKKHVLVGHNLFMDLAFIHKTFIGPLPSNVGHFQQTIHDHFPIVIDTKYLATYNTDAMNPRANLKELLAPFKKSHVPLIVLHEAHTEYGTAYGKEHEAGFDSWMTAELFVKLSAKLYSTYDDSNSFVTAVTNFYCSVASDSDSSSGGGVPLIKTRSASISPKKKTVAEINTRSNVAVPAHMTKDRKIVASTHHTGSAPPMPPHPHSIAATAATTAMTAKIIIPTPFNVRFTQVGTNSFNKPYKSGSRPSSAIPIIDPATPKTAQPAPTSVKTVTPPPPHLIDIMDADAMQDSFPPIHANLLNPSATIIHDTDEEATAVAGEPRIDQWLPGMSDRFWRPYLNILRVNAVKGGICDLAEPLIAEDMADEDEDGENMEVDDEDDE